MKEPWAKFKFKKTLDKAKLSSPNKEHIVGDIAILELYLGCRSSAAMIKFMSTPEGLSCSGTSQRLAMR